MQDTLAKNKQNSPSKDNCEHVMTMLKETTSKNCCNNTFLYFTKHHMYAILTLRGRK